VRVAVCPAGRPEGLPAGRRHRTTLYPLVSLNSARNI